MRRCWGCCSAVPWHGAGGPSRLPNYRWIAAGVRRTRPLSLLAPGTEPQINICNQPWLRQEIIAFALQMNWKMSNNGICRESLDQRQGHVQPGQPALVSPAHEDLQQDL